jgi:hypothetical protein
VRRISETVTRSPHIPGAQDSHGNSVDLWGPPETVGVYAFDPGSTSEPRLPGHDRVIVEPTLYGPYGFPFMPQDRCVARGLVYEVNGVTRDWRNPNGLLPGSVVSLRRVEG